MYQLYSLVSLFIRQFTCNFSIRGYMYQRCCSTILSLKYGRTLSPSYLFLLHIHLWLVLSNLVDPWIYLALRLTKNVARNSTEYIVKLNCHHLQINVEDVGGFYTLVNRRCARYISSPVVSENKSEIQDG